MAAGTAYCTTSAVAGAGGDQAQRAGVEANKSAVGAVTTSTTGTAGTTGATNATGTTDPEEPAALAAVSAGATDAAITTVATDATADTDGPGCATTAGNADTTGATGTTNAEQPAAGTTITAITAIDPGASGTTVAEQSRSSARAARVSGTTVAEQPAAGTTVWTIGSTCCTVADQILAGHCIDEPVDLHTEVAVDPVLQGVVQRRVEPLIHQRRQIKRIRIRRPRPGTTVEQNAPVPRGIRAIPVGSHHGRRLEQVPQPIQSAIGPRLRRTQR